MLYADRLFTLRKKWGFTCTCDLCSSSEAEIAASDARRNRVNDFGVKVIKAVEEQKFKEAIKHHREVIRAIEEEQLTPHLGDYYEVMSRLYSAVRDKKSAVNYAKMALEEFAEFGEGLEGKEDLQMVAKGTIPGGKIRVEN